ncbi:alcohol oxidase [Marasmius fiardii PR-910]|nr:alcohol oxidase [Marasmius fiardii PR-910]
MAQINSEPFDIIFAGGGTSACVTAGRLAAADPSLRILLLEAGPHVRDNPTHVQPGRFYSNLVAPGKTLTCLVANSSKALNGRSPIVLCGRCVGGGSSVNFAMYTRASSSDYDDWEKLGNPGWGSKDLVPLANQVETFQEDGFANHGKSGPIKVSMGDLTTMGPDFLDAAAGYDKDRSATKDTNEFGKCDRYAPWHKYIDKVTGRRSDTAHHFIYNQDHNKNLVVQERCRIIRVIFEGNKAVGVEYTDDRVGRSPEGEAQVFGAHASRLVVVSAGTFGSPAILERSGIGSEQLLQKLDIPVVVDLPGVGENYNDHNLVFTGYHTTPDADTMDDIFHGSEKEVEPYAQQWVKEGKGLMAHNGIDAGIKIRPTEKDLKELGPSFKQRWETFFQRVPDKPVMWIGVLAAYTGKDSNNPRGKYYSILYYTEYPVSTGHVHITAARDPYAQLDFETGFLNEPADLPVLRWSYKHGREIARRMKCYRGAIATHHPVFPEGSAAAADIAKRDGPVDVSAPPLEYTEEDNKAIDEFHRQTVETTWHSLGTCAMKPREMNGVVDSKLNVYGVENLKVADMSIAPLNVGANTYNSALIIGEKAAAIIAREFGIKGF